MANSVDPDQTAASGAVWSGSTLFAYVILSDSLVFEFLGHLPYWFISLHFIVHFIVVINCIVKNVKGKCLGGRVVSALDFRLQVPLCVMLEIQFISWLQGTSLHRAFHYHFSWYDILKRNVKHQSIMVKM